MSQPTRPEPGSSDDRMAASIARIERTRAAALDILGIALAVGGTACLATVLVMLLGLAVAALVLAALVQIALGVALMRRATPLPGWLQVRPPREPAAPGPAAEPEQDAGAPYAPARSLADGAPPSPMSGR